MAIPFLSDIRLPSGGKVYLWTGHNDNFLKYDLWQASASAGMTIKNIANSGSIIFQTNSTTALTLNSSQKANFAGDVVAEAFTGKLQGSITGAPDQTIWRVSGQYTNWGIFYNEGTPDKIEFKAGGTVTSTIALDNGDATFNVITASGAVSAEDNIYLTDAGTIRAKLLLNASDRDNVELRAESLGSTMKFFTVGTEALELDASQNATFTGDVTIGALTSGETAQLIVNQEGGVAPVAKFMSRTNKAIVQVSDNDTTGYVSSENGLFSLGRNAGVNANNINIDSSNRVGIGASNVQEKLHVYNAGTARIEIEGTTGPAAFKATNNQGSFGWYVPSNANNFRLWNFGTSADLVTVDASGNTTTAGNIAIGSGTTGSAYDSSTLIHTKGGSRSIIQQSSTTDAYYMFGDAAANNAAWIGYLHNTGTLQLQAQSNVTINKNTAVTGNISATGSITANAFSGDGSSLTGIALATQANNLQAFDDRDIAPEDLSFSDDLKLFFAEKTGIEGGTVGSDWQDLLILSSYVDSSGGKLNALALDKSTHRILHYNANYNATNWGTAKELAYTSDFVKRTGGTSTSMSGDLHIIAGGPKIYLQDNTDDDDQAIIFRNNAGVDDYKITTQDFTGSGAGDGMFIGSENADQVALVTNDTIALTIDTSQNTTFAGSITGKDNGIIIDSLSGSFGRIHGTSSIFLGGGSTTQVQLSGNIMPDGNNSRSLGTSSRYWSETYTSGVTSGGNIVINSNTPVLTLGVINSSTGNAKVQFYSKNSGTSNGYAVQYNKDTGIDRLEFIDGSGTANIKFNNGGTAEFAGSVTASTINTGQGATEVHLMNQNLRTTDDVTFDDLTVTGNLTITGDINSYNVTDLDITDKTITLGKGQDEGHSGGSGLIVDGSSASILWDESNDTWDFNKGIYITGNDGNVNLDGNAAIIFDNTNNNNGWYIRNGGSNAATLQFGLGTSPGSNIKHTFAGDGSVTFATYVNAATGFRMASGQAIDFVSTNIGYNSIERNTSVGGLQINTGDSASMNILDNGRVGIGTTAPGHKLNVVGANDSTAVGIDIGSNAKFDFAANSTSAYTTTFNMDDTGLDIGHDSTSRALNLKTGGSDRLTISGAGNVGIGATSPGQKLEVAGRVRVTTDPTIEFYESSSKRGGIQWDLTNDYTNIFAVGGNIRFDIGGQKLLIESATSTFETDIVVNSADLKLRNTGTGNAYIKAYAAGTGAAGLYIDAVNGDGAGSDYFSLRQLDSKAIEFNARTGTGNTVFYSKGVLNLTQNGANSTFAGNVESQDTFILNYGGSGNKWQQLFDGSNNWNLRYYNGSSWSSNYLNISTSGDATFAGKITAGKGVNYTGGTIAQATTVLHTNNIVYNIGGSNGIILSNADYSDRYYITNADHRWEVGSADAMRLNSTGLGIGTTNPENKLHILTSTSDTTQQLLIQNGSTGDAAIKFNISGDTYSFGIDNSDSDKFKLSAGNLGTNDRITVDSSGLVGIGTASPTYKLSVPSGGIEAGGKITYSKSAGSLNATGYAVAGITAAANGNGASCGFTFTCFGHTGAYQRIVYSCYNGSGTWYAKKVIDEGTNQLDVAASANGSTITFTFKATSSTMSYTPRVTVEATGHNINSTYA